MTAVAAQPVRVPRSRRAENVFVDGPGIPACGHTRAAALCPQPSPNQQEPAETPGMFLNIGEEVMLQPHSVHVSDTSRLLPNSVSLRDRHRAERAPNKAPAPTAGSQSPQQNTAKEAAPRDRHLQPHSCRGRSGRSSRRGESARSEQRKQSRPFVTATRTRAGRPGPRPRRRETTSHSALPEDSGPCSGAGRAASLGVVWAAALGCLGQIPLSLWVPRRAPRPGHACSERRLGAGPHHVPLVGERAAGGTWGPCVPSRVELGAGGGRLLRTVTC